MQYRQTQYIVLYTYGYIFTLTFIEKHDIIYKMYFDLFRAIIKVKIAHHLSMFGLSEILNR